MPNSLRCGRSMVSEGGEAARTRRGRAFLCLEWRLFGLYQHSIHSKTALAVSSQVLHVPVSSRSSCIVPRKIPATHRRKNRRPYPWSRVARRLEGVSRMPMKYCVPWSKCMMVERSSGWRRATHGERVDDELTGLRNVDGPADDAPRIGIYYGRAV